MKSLCVSAALAGVVILAWTGRPGPASSRSAAASFPKDSKTVLHVLNRAAFGARTGDVERVREMGLQRYIEQQLHPERLTDSAANARLSSFPTLTMGSREIAERYEIPALEARRERKNESARSGDPDAGGHRKNAAAAEVENKGRQVVIELSEAKLVRAIYSERQLEEVLADFWFNHFNIDAHKGADRFLLTEYERDVIRPRVLGRFRDLLGATAKSPAMLFYLDNWMSADPNGPHIDMRRAPFGRRRFMAPDRLQPAKAPRGLNENYGRELMELHTLGVDGGYTQKDVTEVARAFTGWTIQNPRHGGGFRFEPRIHDEGEKVILGHRIRAGGGERDGEQVLDILARHPSTSRFIANALVRRFVSDAPPPALVDRAALRFRTTDGDLREVTRTILTSPEFLGPEAYRAKVKTPFEFVVSAVRATGADVHDALGLVRSMQQLGMPLYQCQPPTGYRDTAEAWVNSGALIGRMNFALALASNKLRGITLVDPQSTPDTLLGGDLSESTRATIAQATSGPQRAALTLGSPEFQKR